MLNVSSVKGSAFVGLVICGQQPLAERKPSGLGSFPLAEEREDCAWIATTLRQKASSKDDIDATHAGGIRANRTGCLLLHPGMAVCDATRRKMVDGARPSCYSRLTDARKRSFNLGTCDLS